MRIVGLIVVTVVVFYIFNFVDDGFFIIFALEKGDSNKFSEDEMLKALGEYKRFFEDLEKERDIDDSLFNFKKNSLFFTQIFTEMLFDSYDSLYDLENFFALSRICTNGVYFDDKIGKDVYLYLLLEPEAFSEESEYENGKRKRPLPLYILPGIPMPPQIRKDGCEWVLYDVEYLKFRFIFVFFRLYFQVYSDFTFILCKPEEISSVLEYFFISDIFNTADSFYEMELRRRDKLLSVDSDGDFIISDPDHPGYGRKVKILG